MHEVAADVCWYLPEGQLVHATASAAEYCPEGQTESIERLEVAQYKPARQVVHAAAALVG